MRRGAGGGAVDGVATSVIVADVGPPLGRNGFVAFATAAGIVSFTSDGVTRQLGVVTVCAVVAGVSGTEAGVAAAAVIPVFVSD